MTQDQVAPFVKSLRDTFTALEVIHTIFYGFNSHDIETTLSHYSGLGWTCHRWRT